MAVLDIEEFAPKRETSGDLHGVRLAGEASLVFRVPSISSDCGTR